MSMTKFSLERRAGSPAPALLEGVNNLRASWGMPALQASSSARHHTLH